jgi:hypothetical protein
VSSVAEIANAKIPDGIALDFEQNVYVVYENINYQSVSLLSIDANTRSTRFISNLNKSSGSMTVGNLHCSRPLLSADNSLAFVLTHMYIQSGGLGFYRYLHAIRTSDGVAEYTALEFPVSTLSGFDSLARDAFDRVYFTAVDVNRNGVLYGVQNGAVFLTYTIDKYPITPTGGENNSTIAIGAPAVGSDGTIYFGVNVNVVDSVDATFSYVYAVRPNGTLLWQKRLQNLTPIEGTDRFNVITTSPSIAFNGDIIISTDISNSQETSILSRIHKITSN